MLQSFENIGIEAIASVIPNRIITNNYFEGLLTSKEQKVFEKTVGILERRWVTSDKTAMDMGFNAIQLLINSEIIKREDIGCLIFLSQTSDYKIPFSSNLLQSKLGLNKNILCLDINAGCAGFIQGLSTAFAITDSLCNHKKTILIIAETLSKILSLKDRSTSMLFGDGASAIIVKKQKGFKKTLFDIYSDGEGASAICIPDGGCRNPANPKSFDISIDKNGNQISRMNLHMNGQKVLDFTFKEIAPSIKSFISQAGLTYSDIDYYLLHQSNAFIIKQIANTLQEDREKFLINIQKVGNTSGVSIPLLISDNYDKLKEANHLLLCGYGSGLNWGNCVINLSDTRILPIKEYVC